MEYKFLILMISIILFILMILFIFIFTQLYTRPVIYNVSEIEGGDISRLVGPVDMLQMPKQLLMDGYRFQNPMFPPEEINRRLVTACEHQRVGIFKDKAYIDSLPDQEGGHEGASLATIAQVKARGDQDKYLIGSRGDPIVDSEKPFGKWVQYGPTGVKREINYPNKVFSWGDVLYRYRGEFHI